MRSCSSRIDTCFESSDAALGCTEERGVQIQDTVFLDAHDGDRRDAVDPPHTRELLEKRRQSSHLPEQRRVEGSLALEGNDQRLVTPEELLAVLVEGPGRMPAVEHAVRRGVDAHAHQSGDGGGEDEGPEREHDPGRSKRGGHHRAGQPSPLIELLRRALVRHRSLAPHGARHERLGRIPEG
jgi:hypothetical protein